MKPPPVARQTSRKRCSRVGLLKRTRASWRDFSNYAANGQFEPPSLEGTIVFPGFDGGPGWGGAAFDPETGFYYVNSSEVPCVLRLIEQSKRNNVSSGKDLYERHCASCHGVDLQGSPPEFPTLVKIARKYNAEELRTVIREGSGRMPGFASLGRESVQAVAQYLLSGDETKVSLERSGPSPMDLRYRFDGYKPVPGP
jgi:quinoprotein glucose dehydrogenase